eukprot:CAMPEP_0205816654 /NCGR_PEP_ID=MMETSP0205-20121125/23092_1 /ASSEMBLY_ACC=CAM_ASM_000278 /TAXON_ID=36767 /ORGANISM="Euplotes focardii, Strain TN1" /LENGTH=83 /DNA_ID=CAMNT_0053105517 /DNA_START=24 /DNA_END=275 /DNA_ORIENTATION=-
MEDLERYLLTESNSRTNSKDRGFRPWDQGDMETNRDITLGITLGGYAVLCIILIFLYKNTVPAQNPAVLRMDSASKRAFESTQ